MFSQMKVVLDNGTSIEVHGDQVLCFTDKNQTIHLTPAQECMLKVFAEKINVRVTSSELYSAYSKEAIFWNPKEINLNVSKLIHTFPLSIRKHIDNVRGKGYRLTGRKIQVAPHADKDTAIAEETQNRSGIPSSSKFSPPANSCLKSTHIQTKPVFVVDKKREQLFEKIDHAFQNGYNAVFLRGFGGIGKSEFAKQYARKRKEDGTYSTVVFAPIDIKRGNVNLQTLTCDDTVFSITNFPKRNETVNLKSDGSLESLNESMEEYFVRKYAKIREICGQETLIIIDNFDVAHDREIIRFLEGNYHVIITTRYKFPDIDCPQIEIEHMDHEALTELFFRNSRRNDIHADDPALIELFDLLGHHTMSIEILAKFMAEDEMVSLSDISKQLRQRGSLANLDGSIQMSSMDTERRPFEYITALFDISSLLNDKYSDDFKTILSCMCLMPSGGVKKSDFLNWCGIKSAIALNKLVQRSWIFEEERDQDLWISMHSVVTEVMLHQFRPSLNTCRNLIESLVCISKDAYFLNLKQASQISPVLKRIIYLCPVNGIEHYETYLSFANFFALREEPESAKEVLSALLSYVERNHIVDPVLNGDLCRIYGVYFSCLRKNCEATEWRKKAISFYHDSGKLPEEIQNLKIEIAWNHLNRHDVPAAVAAVTELDTWLSKARSATRQKGALLHLKARIEYEQGHYDAAKACDTVALAIFEELSINSIDCGSAYYILGLANTKCEETFEEGISPLKKCLSIWKDYRSQSSTNLIDIHRMIADAYFDKKRYSDALSWYQKCLSLLTHQAAKAHSEAIRAPILMQIEQCKAEHDAVS